MGMALSPDAIFSLVNAAALPGWLWLATWLWLPAGWQQRTRHIGLVLPTCLALIYTVLALVHLGSADGGYDTLAGVMSLFRSPGATLAGWVHFLAFDLVVGWCITRHGSRHCVGRLSILFSLFVTFVLGPFGLLIYGLIFMAAHIVGTDPALAVQEDSVRHQLLRGNPVLARCGLVLLGVTPCLVLAMVVDPRTLLESNVWLKPVKFAVSLLVYMLSLSWYSAYLTPRYRRSGFVRMFSIVVVMAVTAEMVWLVIAAMIGELSHFNETHPVLSGVYIYMGGVAVVLTAMTPVVGFGLWLYRDSALHPLIRYSLIYALFATFVLTVPVAGYLAGVPGANESSGDPLRLAHFLGTHAMHFVPLVGVALVYGFSGRDSAVVGRARLLAAAVCGVYGLLVVGVFLQAVSGGGTGL